MTAAGGNPMAMATRGPPYAPTTAILGGQPKPSVDDPICAVLIGLYVIAAVFHVAIYRINRKRDHKFVFSTLLLDFCLARITTLSVRMAWASHPRSVNLAIAAGILVQAGVLLLFVVNLIFAQRIVRSHHPKLGWSKQLGLAFKFLYFCIVVMLIMVIIASVYTFFTLDTAVRQDLRRITLVAGTFLALVAFLPVPITVLSILARPRSRRPEKFGAGRDRAKLALLLATALLLSLGAGFRAGTNFAAPRALAAPAWFHSRACFYAANFGLELLVAYAYLVSRFDRRFHVPDGAAAPGDYGGGGGGVRMAEPSPVRPSAGSRGSSVTLTWTFEVNREADVFGDDGSSTVESVTVKWVRQSLWEASALNELKKEAAQFTSAA